MRRFVTGVITLSILSTAAAQAGNRSFSTAPPVGPVYVAEATAPAETKSSAEATMSFAGGQIAAGIGFSWGNGTIAYQGAQHPFHISGLSLVNVGVSSVSASGEVYNLKRIEDFNGTYAAVSAGATLGGGGSIAYLRNQEGVVIEVTSTMAGLDFQLAANGITISLN